MAPGPDRELCARLSRSLRPPRVSSSSHPYEATIQPTCRVENLRKNLFRAQSRCEVGRMAIQLSKLNNVQDTASATSSGYTYTTNDRSAGIHSASAPGCPTPTGRTRLLNATSRSLHNNTAQRVYLPAICRRLDVHQSPSLQVPPVPHASMWRVRCKQTIYELRNLKAMHTDSAVSSRSSITYIQ